MRISACVRVSVCARLSACVRVCEVDCLCLCVCVHTLVFGLLWLFLSLIGDHVFFVFVNVLLVPSFVIYHTTSLPRALPSSPFLLARLFYRWLSSKWHFVFFSQPSFLTTKPVDQPCPRGSGFDKIATRSFLVFVLVSHQHTSKFNTLYKPMVFWTDCT